MEIDSRKTTLHVALFIDSLVAGGAQRQVVETALQLAKNGHRVSVIIYHDIRELGAELSRAGIEVLLIKKNAKLSLSFLWRLYRCFRDISPDVLHCFLFVPNLWGRLIGRLARVPVVITSERNVDLPQSRLRVWIERVIHRLGDCIIVNAEAIRTVLVDVVGVPSDRIHTVYNGVDLERFKRPAPEILAAKRTELGVRTGDFVITLPGRVIPQKNHACLMRAIAALGPEANIRLLFVGNLLDVPYCQGLEAMVVDLGLKNVVSFVGRQDDMAAIYAISDVVVLPSLWEGFPNVVLEAMAAGRPVIASDIADNAVLVHEGVTGYLFPNGDDVALAAALRRMFLMVPNEREHLGLGGFSLVASRFSSQALLATNLSLYRTFLELKGGKC